MTCFDELQKDLKTKLVDVTAHWVPVCIAEYPLEVPIDYVIWTDLFLI